MARRGRKPTAEELALWRFAMRDARPLRKADAEAVAAILAEDAPPPAKPTARKPSTAKAAPPRATPSVPRDGAAPRNAGLDAATARRARRGQLGIDAVLDLHGLRQDEAHDALAGFIERSFAAGRRAVLIITGKGTFAPEGTERGVLRRLVPRWLGEAPLRTRVHAVLTSHQRHGGDGALYVLLKRKRGT